MARIALALVVVVLAIAVQVQPGRNVRQIKGAPLSFDEIVEAAKSGNYEKFQSLINADLANNPAWKPVNLDSIKDLKPPQGGKVYGEAEFTFQTSSDFNGQKTEESGGHKIINDNGNIKEFDIKP